MPFAETPSLTLHHLKYVICLLKWALGMCHWLLLLHFQRQILPRVILSEELCRTLTIKKDHCWKVVFNYFLVEKNELKSPRWYYNAGQLNKIIYIKLPPPQGYILQIGTCPLFKAKLSLSCFPGYFLTAACLSLTLFLLELIFYCSIEYVQLENAWVKKNQRYSITFRSVDVRTLWGNRW